MCYSTFHIAQQHSITKGDVSIPERYLFRKKHPTTYVVGCFLAGAQGLEP